jgi:electron transfer flavoprotein beta subunit
MKFLVCISKTPDTVARIAFTPDGSKFDEAGVTFILNPYDEWYALVRALELKEKLGGTVTVINVGLAANDQTIRKALAIGADDAVRIDADPKSALYTARQIAAYAQGKGYDIILTGKETIDYNGSEVGGMLAEYMDLPYVSYANSLEMAGNTATIGRDIEGGVEMVEVATPFVVSAAKGMAEQRIPNMQGIMRAKMKPLAVVAAAAFTDLSTVVKFTLPAQKTGVKLVSADNVEELVRLLHEEAKAF